ncbi:MAG: CBS domain-containing protein [Urechidicola sp.]|nr:CBS domain-containing protein [Urechidicola sp.]
MNILEYISKDINALALNNTIGDAKELFSNTSYSHLPIVEGQHLVGSILDSDVISIEDNDKTIGEYKYLLNDFFTRTSNNWMEILKSFAASETNILPVLNNDNYYVGFYELVDVLHYFNDTPLLNNDGFFLVVEKGIHDYSFSQIAQIVESFDAKLVGVFVSGYKNDLVRITLKITTEDINEIIQSFRRYGYNLLTKHKEDLFLEELKDRSDYLQKYLNI